MARIPSRTRIQKEDFPSESRDLIEKLAPTINTFIEQTVDALNGNLDFTNLNRELITVDVTVNASGIPKVDTKFKIHLKTKLAGLKCINAINVTSSTVYPTTAPFLTVAQNGDIITVKHISGLQADNRYQLRLECIGF